MEWRRWVVVWTCFLFLGWAEPDGPALTVEAIACAYPTPELLAQFLRKQIRFETDTQLFGEPDHWQTPKEFLAQRAGDCEDYALLAQAVLSKQGREAFVLSLFGPDGYAHTVCVFIEAGRYNVMNQDRIVRYRAKSLEQLASSLYPSWSWAAVTVQAGNHGRLVHEIRNPSPAPSRFNDFGNFPFY